MRDCEPLHHLLPGCQWHHRPTYVHTSKPLSQFCVTVHNTTSLKMPQVTGSWDEIAFIGTPMKVPSHNTPRHDGCDQASRYVEKWMYSECSHLGKIEQNGAKLLGNVYPWQEYVLLHWVQLSLVFRGYTSVVGNHMPSMHPPRSLHRSRARCTSLYF